MSDRISEQFQFGPFTLVPTTGDLYKGKTRIRLQQHPLTVLLLLLERPGEVITREEIRNRVWPHGTIVEFDHSINTAVNKLRAALSDRAEKSRYIETFARRGYRFVAPVQRVAGAVAQAAPPEGDIFAAGSIVSHYRVEELIGSGAMGRVFSAVDLTLGRRVALKVLHEGAADRGTIARFRREAQAISALDHPNICSVHEFGEHAGRPFLTMQFLSGEDLARRLAAQGALDIDGLVKMALDITLALEAAHARGIIHRDIKPANIFVTGSGLVKILDFGLAKLVDEQHIAESPAVVGPSPSPRMTRAGAVMGTAAYMSPEQIRGEPVDLRTDVFSFGLVLYEMATGRHPFAEAPEEDVPELLLNAQIPPPAAQNPAIAPTLDALIRKALERDRARRFSSFVEVRRILEDIHRGLLGRQQQDSSVLRRWPKTAVAVSIALVAILLAALPLRRAGVEANLVVRPLTSSPGLKEHVAPSPDDSRIVYAWYADGHNEDIYVQSLGSAVPVRLTEDAARDFSPAWSPDGRSVAFMRSRSGRTALYIVPAAGGAERMVAEMRTNPAPFCRAIDWSPNGEHLAVTEWRPQFEGGPALVLVSAANGARVRQLLAHRGEFLCAPAFSPDGSSIAVLQGTDFRASDVHVVSVAGGAERRITFDARMIQGLTWSSDGASLIYSFRRSGPFGLWQVPARGGASRTLLETGNDVVDPRRSSKSGQLVFVRDLWDTNIWRVEGPEWKGPRAGPVRVIEATREDAAVDVSPDSRRLVFSSARTGAFELWVSGIDGSEPRRLTHFNGPETGYPRWSPDGKLIVFNSYPDGRPGIFVISADGGEPRRRSDGEMPFWSADGKWIYFQRNDGGLRALWRIPAETGDGMQVMSVAANLLLSSIDGSEFLYDAEDGLRRISRNGGAAETIAREVVAGMWSPAPGGACYLRYGQGTSFNVDCVRLAVRSRSRVASLGSWPGVYGPPGFAVSRDGKWIFYRRVDQLESNIMVAEGVR